MTLNQMLDDCYRRLGFQVAAPQEVQTRLTGYINDTQQTLASDPALALLLRGALSFTTAAGRPEYGLPSAVARVRAIRETTTNRRLRQESLDWYRWAVPNQSQQQGTPDRYVLLGPLSVQRQPSGPMEILALSSANTDTAILHYEVRTTDGVRTGTVTLNGTAPVSLSSSITTIEEILDWYLDAPAAGTVRLTELLGTELARITVGQTRATYQGLAFVPTPSSPITYLLDYERDVTDLIVGQDAPVWLPARFHRLLGVGARKQEYEATGDSRFQMTALEYVVELNKLKAFVNNPPDQTMVPGRSRGGHSDLGGMYPAGTVWD
jgi:hypothetical protein